MWFRLTKARHLTKGVQLPGGPLPQFKALSPSFGPARLREPGPIPEALGLEGPDRAEAPLLSIEPRPRVASIRPEPVRLEPPIYRRRPMSRALLALTLLGLGGLPRGPDET